MKVASIAMKTKPKKRSGKPDPAVLADIVRRIVRAAKPEKIVLFGSAARGTMGPDSDYDLMVIVPDTMPLALRKSGRAYEALWGLRAASDVLVWTREAFDRQLHLKASLPSTIIREGRLLYGARSHSGDV